MNVFFVEVLELDQEPRVFAYLEITGKFINICWWHIVAYQTWWDHEKETHKHMFTTETYVDDIRKGTDRIKLCFIILSYLQIVRDMVRRQVTGCLTKIHLGLNVLHGVLCGQLSSHPELERIGPLSDKCQFNDIQYCMNIYNKRVGRNNVITTFFI